MIERRDNEFIIRDLGSWRHTYVNGILVHELPLADGDVIQMGPTVQLSFNLVRQEQPLPVTARVPVELEPGSSMAVSQGGAKPQNGEQTEITEPRIVAEKRLKGRDLSLETPVPEAAEITEELAASAQSTPFEFEQEKESETMPAKETEAEVMSATGARSDGTGNKPLKDLKLSALAELEQALAGDQGDDQDQTPPEEECSEAESELEIRLGLDDELDMHDAPKPAIATPLNAEASQAKNETAAQQHEIDLDDLDLDVPANTHAAAPAQPEPRSATGGRGEG